MTHKPKHSLTVKSIPILIAWLLCTPLAQAEVKQSAPDHYILYHEARSHLSPEALWERLVNPASWWHPDHTYSGKAEHLSLDPRAGGQWREDWDGGSVIHGEVIYVNDGQQLRLEAPFGPLQEMAVDVIWTITLSPDDQGTDDKGTRVIFTEIANGTSASKLDEIAPAVDGVKREAIERLVSIK